MGKIFFSHSDLNVWPVLYAKALFFVFKSDVESEIGLEGLNVNVKVFKVY